MNLCVLRFLPWLAEADGRRRLLESLLWDGEHRFPNNVGPEGLRPTKAWEIYPIKQIAER